MGEPASGLTRHIAVVENGDGDFIPVPLQASAEGALWVALASHIAGARNASSTTLDYQRAIPTGTPQRFDIGASTETLVKASPAVLLAIIPNAGHTGNVLLRNAASTGGGSTPVFLLDLGPGEPVTLSSEFSAGITIEGTDAACDVTLVFGDL